MTTPRRLSEEGGAVHSVRVPATAASVRGVRALLRRELADLPTSVRDDVVLVASELFCNALQHGRRLDDGMLEVCWDVTPDGVQLAVVDGGGPTLPAVQDVGTTATAGRGLSIVARLVSRWGVDRQPGRTMVWAIVPIQQPERVCC
ncbi:ATP-binding protein [Acidothermus cellulolyticus]|nr:ATP-binding protein [Acidothermus cellulolyticus]